MLHQLQSNSQFDRHFVARGDRIMMPHTTGHRFDENERKSVTEAFTEADMMWPVHRIAIKVKFKGEVIDTGKFALVKDPPNGKPEVLSMVGANYQPVQNRQLAYWLDVVSNQYPVEGVGYIGTNIVVVFSGKSWAVQASRSKSDEVKDLIVVTNAFETGTAMYFKAISRALYCTNQMDWLVSKPQRGALKSGYGNNDSALTLAHTDNGYRAIEYIASRLAELAKSEPMRHDFIQYLAQKPLTQDEYQRVVNAALPDPSVPRLLRTINNAHEMASANVGMEAISTTPELGTSIEKAEKNYDYLVRRTNEQRLLVDESLDERSIGRTAYATLQAIGETLEWESGQKTEYIGYDMIAGSRSNQMKRALHEVHRIIDMRA